MIPILPNVLTIAIICLIAGTVMGIIIKDPSKEREDELNQDEIELIIQTLNAQYYV